MNRKCPIKGFQGTTLIDYPGRIASIVYTGGCNFRCRYCYNTELLSAATLPDMDHEAVFSELRGRAGFIDGVVVTGGEPTLHPGIIDLLKELKRMRLPVKLDTNGTHPEILEWIIVDGLAEYIAMDYKAPLDKLEDTACIRGAEEKVYASARMLIETAARYEFRTTVHPSLLTMDDVEIIVRELRGARAWYLQQFHPVHCLDASLLETAPYPVSFFRRAADFMAGCFPVFAIRNLREPLHAAV